MALKNVTYVRAKDMTKEQKQELQIEESINGGLIAIESHNPEYRRKAVVIKKGLVNYVLNGD